MLTRAKQLIESADTTESEKAELALLYNAVGRWQKEYKDTPIQKYLNEWQQAKAALEKSVTAIWPRYYPDDPIDQPHDAAEILLTQAQAKRELRAAGYKVSDGKLSMDWGDKIPVQRGGQAKVAAIIQYAGALRGESEGSISLAEEKTKKEIEKLDLSNERARIDNRKEDERWTLREAAEIQAAALAGLIKDTVGHHLNLARTRLLHVAGGNTAAAAEFGEELENILRSAFNEIANTRETEIDIEEE